MSKTLAEVKVGDTVHRYLSATMIYHPLTVTEIVGDEIRCATPCGTDYWTFCRKTGAEIDKRFGWGPEQGITGSFISAVPRLPRVTHYEGSR